MLEFRHLKQNQLDVTNHKYNIQEISFNSMDMFTVTGVFLHYLWSGQLNISRSAILPLNSSHKIQGIFIPSPHPQLFLRDNSKTWTSFRKLPTKTQAIFKFCSCTSWSYSLLSIEYLVLQIKYTFMWAFILLLLPIQSQNFCTCFLGCNKSHSPSIKCQWKKVFTHLEKNFKFCFHITLFLLHNITILLAKCNRLLN